MAHTEERRTQYRVYGLAKTLLFATDAFPHAAITDQLAYVDQ